MKLDDIKHGLSTFIDSVTEGWQHLRQSASTAMTRFRPGEQTNLPAASEIDDLFYLPSGNWSMLAGEVFEDEQKVVVRLELPGMNKEDFDIQILNTTLMVRSEKRFEREQTEGRYRVMQCAYGSFERRVVLPVEVRTDKATATYKNGVLRVELPKAEAARPRKRTITVE